MKRWNSVARKFGGSDNGEIEFVRRNLLAQNLCWISRRKRDKIQRGTFVPVEILIDCPLFQRNWERMPVSGDQVRFLTKVNPSSGIVRGGEESSHAINYPSVDIGAKYFDGLLCWSTHSSSLSKNLLLFSSSSSSFKKRNITFERFDQIWLIWDVYFIQIFIFSQFQIICCDNIKFDDKVYYFAPRSCRII